VLDDGTFFEHLRGAAEKYFTELEQNTSLQGEMLARLNNAAHGGAIYVSQ
jgi:hypothetical protein